MRLFPKVDIGIIGGSGITEIKGMGSTTVIPREHFKSEYFGMPSSDVTIGKLEGRTVAFLLRHGEGHWLNPRQVPYSANAFTMKQLCVGKVIAFSACGTLVPDKIHVGTLTVPHQLVDFSGDPNNTLFSREGLVLHTSMEPPFCGMTRQEAISAIKEAGLEYHGDARYITIKGPHYSSMAESLVYIQLGNHAIGMTTGPEAKCFKDANICYAVVILPTDRIDERVSGDVVLSTMKSNFDKVQKMLPIFIRNCTLGECECHHSTLGGLHTRYDLVPESEKGLLELIEGKRR